MARNYNFIYSKITKGESDLIGHIAYSLYKADKIKHIEKLKGANGNTDPTDQQLAAYHEATCSPSIIDGYRIKAEAILQEFTENTLSETVTNIEADTQSRHAELLQEIIKPIKPLTFFQNFLSGVGENIVAAFAVVAITVIVILSIRTANYGWQQAAHDTFGISFDSDSTKTGR